MLAIYSFIYIGQYLFGKDLSRKLSISEFEQFYDNIHHDILQMEFNIYKPVNGLLSEYNFAKIIINGCDFKQDVVDEYLKRVSDHYSESAGPGISFESVKDFMRHVVYNIEDVDKALQLYFMGGASISQSEFR